MGEEALETEGFKLYPLHVCAALAGMFSMWPFAVCYNSF